MILQALKEYYDRKASDSDSGIVPLGWERKEIPYIIVLDANGIPVNIVSNVYWGEKIENRGKKKREC